MICAPYVPFAALLKYSTVLLGSEFETDDLEEEDTERAGGREQVKTLVNDTAKEEPKTPVKPKVTFTHVNPVRL